MATSAERDVADPAGGAATDVDGPQRRCFSVASQWDRCDCEREYRASAGSLVAGELDHDLLTGGGALGCPGGVAARWTPRFVLRPVLLAESLDRRRVLPSGAAAELTPCPGRMHENAHAVLRIKAGSVETLRPQWSTLDPLQPVGLRIEPRILNGTGHERSPPDDVA